MILRPYQSRAFADIRATIAAGHKRVVVVGPTGSGKTVLFSAIVSSALSRPEPTRTLVVAHRKELVRQPFCRLMRFGIDPANVGIIMSGVESSPSSPVVPMNDMDDDEVWRCYARRRPTAPVQIASVDTYRARKSYQEYSLIILDEAHRALSPSFLNIIRANPTAPVLGFTATPYLGNGDGLGKPMPVAEGSDERAPVFTGLVVVASYLELVDDGFLVLPRTFSVPEDMLPDLSALRTERGDYDPVALAEIMDSDMLVGDIVDHWIRRGNNAPTFAFGVNVKHSRHIAERFVARGIQAVHVDANTEHTERDAALRDLRAGAVKVLCNVDVFSTGTDVPAVGTIVLARPTQSEIVYRQQAGRGSRPYPGKEFVILDHAGSARKFGRIELPRPYTLAAKTKKVKRGRVDKSCPACWTTTALSARTCPECGHEYAPEPVERVVEEQPGELVEMTEEAPRRMSRAERLAIWERLCAECIETDRKPGWVTASYLEQVGERPPADFKLPSMRAPNQEHVAALDSMLSESYSKGHKLGAAKFRFKERFGQWPSTRVIEATAFADGRGVKEIEAAFAVPLGERASDVAVKLVLVDAILHACQTGDGSNPARNFDWLRGCAAGAQEYMKCATSQEQWDWLRGIVVDHEEARFGISQERYDAAILELERDGIIADDPYGGGWYVVADDRKDAFNGRGRLIVHGVVDEDEPIGVEQLPAQEQEPANTARVIQWAV